MADQNEPLAELLATCTYPEFVQALQIEGDDVSELVRHLRSASAALTRTLIGATNRLCAEDLAQEEILVLFGVSQVCIAHLELLKLCCDWGACGVDPRRLYGHSDDDLIYIADYARAVLIEPSEAGLLPAIDTTRRQVATVAASVLAALAVRGYDPPQVADRGAEQLFGAYVMNDVLRPESLTDVLDNIEALLPYPAQCAAPVFAELYAPGHPRFQPEHAATILSAVMAACEEPIEILGGAPVDDPEDPQ